MAKYHTVFDISNIVMDVSSILTMSLVIILIMMILVFSLELLIPIQLKFDMNGICRGYIYKVEAKGHLSDEEETSLKSALNEIGLSSPLISIEKEGNRFGDQVQVLIEASYKQNKLLSLFSRQERLLKFKYERTYFIRKITN